MERGKQYNMAILQPYLQNGCALYYLEVKYTELHSIRGLTVGKEGLVVEDTSHSSVRVGRFRLGSQRWSIWIYRTVEVSDHTQEMQRKVLRNETKH